MVNGYPRAGEITRPPLLVPGIDTIDASAVDTSLLGVFHQYYADNKTFLSELFSLIRDKTPAERFGLAPVAVGSRVYWIFKPAAH